MGKTANRNNYGHDSKSDPNVRLKPMLKHTLKNAKDETHSHADEATAPSNYTLHVFMCVKIEIEIEKY